MRHLARRDVSRASHRQRPGATPDVSSWVPQLALGAVVVLAVALAAGVALMATGVLGPAPQPRLATESSSGSGAAGSGAPQGGETAEVPAAPAVAPRFTPGTVPRAGGGAAQGWARTLLGRWDQARSRAWQDVDDSALAALYVEGSSAGTRDVELLGRWHDAGVEVRALSLRLDEVDVVAVGARRTLLSVRDRLRVSAVDTTALAGGTHVLRLGRDRPATRLVELQVQDGRWRVARVEPTTGG